MENLESRYISRIVDKEIEEGLKDFSAILIRGPKWCGKTTSGEHFSKSVIKLTTKKQKEEFDQMYAANPKLFLIGEKPRLIDEWQTYPMIWDEIREFADTTHLKNQFIMTGSFSPRLGTINHNGSMRIFKIDMTTMSLYESGDSTGDISLFDLFNRPYQDIAYKSNITREQITELIVKGGWPEGVLNPPSNLTIYGKQALKDICEFDIQEASRKALSPITAKALLRSLARTISEPTDNKTIVKNVNESGHPLSESSFYEYYNALLKLFVIKEIPAWSPNIRSASSIRSLPKKEFFDPSLACACLGLGVGGVENDRKTRGFLFECLVGRDLEVYAKSIGGELSYYRDRLGLECDYVIHLEDGRYGLFEVKCGDEKLQDGLNHLREFDKLISKYNEQHLEKNMNKPTVKAIITDMEYAYKTEDGIFVIPLTCLKN